jgi:outer membrane protein assembly complex protein YaeT
MQAMERFTAVAPRMMAVLLGLLLCDVLTFAQEPAPPRKVLVGDVIIRGNTRKSTDEIKALLKTQVGSEYSPEQIQEDVRTLMATNQFGNIRPHWVARQDGKVDIIFYVVDYPNIVEEVVYQGGKSLKKGDYEKELRIKKGEPLNPHMNLAACRTIVRMLNDKGRPFASCQLLEGDKPGDKRVVFSIVEGPQVFVRDIEFTGNTFVSGGVLRQHINSSRRFLGIHAFSKPYIPAMADNDVDELRKYYRSFGYHDVRISREVEWDPSSKTVVLIFHINEGVRYHVKNTPEILGQASVPKGELQRVIQVKAEELYDQRKIDRDVHSLEDYEGYTGRKLSVQERVYYTAPGECSVFYDVDERPQAYVGQIFISGNTTTKQNVILRQLQLFPGQPLAYPEIKRSEDNLKRINLFENNPETGVHPTISVLDERSDNPYKDILVNVQETRTGSLLFGVGFNSDAGATGSIVLNERNFDIFNVPRSFEELLSGNAFRGAGQELRIEAVPGTQLQRYTFQFREPYLFDSPYSLTVGGYYYQRQFDEDLESRLGGKISVARRLNQYWTASLTYRAENVGIHDVSFFAPPDYQNVVGNNFLTSGRLGVTRDTRDSILRPTEGNILELGYEQFFGDNTFPQFTVDFNQYFTVWQRADGSGRQVLAFHSMMGYSGNNTPVYERFYAGGFRSLRGFQFRGVGPDINGFKVGGDFEFINSVEYQVPVLPGDNVYLVGFLDSGTVEPRVEIKDYRVSAGFGIRFTVPMLGPVPIALDFGFPIVRADSDRTQVFSFWLGFFR